MKYYKKQDGCVICFLDDGSQDSLIPNGALLITNAEYEVLTAPTTTQKIEAVKSAVQAHLDAPAKALGYDDIKAACTYADEPAVPLFQAQGQAFRAWRSLVWAKCYDILADVEAETRTEPTIEELLAELPVLTI